MGLQWMKHWAAMGLVVSTFLFAGCQGAAAESQLIFTEIAAPSLQNNIIGDKDIKKLAVILPASYGTGQKSYPVLYFLTGYGDTVKNYGPILKAGLDQAAASGKNSEMIIVAVQGTNRLAGAFYANSSVAGNWEDYVVKDVIGYVDSQYRTMKKREGRGLSGHSMGGSGTVNIGLHRPDIFSRIYAMSPGVFAPDGMEKTNLRIHGIGNYGAMTREAAREAYMKEMDDLDWPEIFTYAYGSTFSPDPAGKAPYIAFVPEGAGKDNLVWKNWDRGYGDMKGKVAGYLKGGIGLQEIVIDYGRNDEFAWIPQGCEYLSALLRENQISHQLLPYDGKHEDKVAWRIQEFLIPYFGEKWNSK